jgi:MoaA/NifB/PqqE/SkfB family radical SAM enzyme
MRSSGMADFFKRGCINCLDIVVRNSFLRSVLFRIIHLAIRLRLRITGKVDLVHNTSHYQWLIMLDAILSSIDRTLTTGAVHVQVVSTVARLWLKVLLNPDRNKPVLDFKAVHNTAPPAFLVISPGKSCNLACDGCYANSDSREIKLDWDITNRLIEDAKRLWGINLITFSGGEPLLYNSHGKCILDIVEAHPDLLFLMFTNGTLINKEIADRLRKTGNLTPAISVEGMEQTTDRHRGKGVFQTVLNSMEQMRKAGVPFGISVTVDANNINEVSSEEFIDFFFQRQNAFYAFYFQYLPIGRIINLKSMPSPEQRVDFYNKIQRVINRKRYFIVDFWNHGNLVNGCIAAGREDGYLYIDWEGKVMPCVFIPYSAGNIKDTYNNGGSLNDLWQSDFFKAIREWQSEYRCSNDLPDGLKWLMPCPFRDHHEKFSRWVQEFKPEPEDLAADESISNTAYRNYMCDYGRRLEIIVRSISDKTAL